MYVSCGTIRDRRNDSVFGSTRENHVVIFIYGDTQIAAAPTG